MADDQRWYRPALDGVRGLAVISVMLVHAHVPGTPGGFIGVDVFFTLSGFLITGLLVREFRETGRIRLGAFWGRRARRLLPAVFAMLFAVAGYAAWAAPDISRVRLAADAAATLGYVANWRFVAADPGYFEQFGDPSPVLHTWSLSVEEQFYLVWPLLVAAALYWGRRRIRRGLPKAAAVAMAFVALAAGVALSALATWRWSSDPTALPRVYYGTDTRAQELLAGACLAVLAHRSGWWDRAAAAQRNQHAGTWHDTAVDALGLAGLAGLTAVVLTAGDPQRWLHQGGELLVSVLAAAVVAAAAHPASGVVQRILSWRPLTAVGLVSYGLYVWHWPVYVLLTPDRTGLHGALLALTRLATAAAVAVVSYHLVEMPVRSRPFWRWAAPAGPSVGGRRSEAQVLVAFGTSLACLGAVLVATSGATMSAAAQMAAGPDPVLPSWGDTTASASPPAPGPTGTAPPAAPLSVFLLGDSTAWNLHHDYPPAPSLRVQVAGSTKLGCDLMGGVLMVNGRPVDTPLPGCSTWTAEWHQQVAQLRPDLSVYLLGQGELFDHQADGQVLRFATPAYEAHLDTFWEQVLTGLRASSRRVAVMNLPCFAERDTGLNGVPAVVNDFDRQRWLNAALQRFVAAHPGLVDQVIDLRSYVCPDEHYLDQIAGVRLRSDGAHWTSAGAGLIWTWLARQIGAGG